MKIFPDDTPQGGILPEVLLHSNRVKMATAVSLVLILSFTVNLFVVYFFLKGQISSSDSLVVLNVFCVAALGILVFQFPYHPRHHGFTRYGWRKNVVLGLSIGIPLGLLGVALRPWLIHQGYTLFEFRFTWESLIYRLSLYPVVAFSQEALIKGYLQSYFVSIFRSSGIPKWPAIVLPAFVFAQFHLSAGLGVLAVTLVFGLVTGWIYEKTRSIVGIGIIHILSGSGLLMFTHYN